MDALNFQTFVRLLNKQLCLHCPTEAFGDVAVK